MVDENINEWMEFEEEAVMDFDEHVEKFIELRKNVDVKLNVKKAQERQKKYYNARHQKTGLEAGQLLLVNEEIEQKGWQN